MQLEFCKYPQVKVQNRNTQFRWYQKQNTWSQECWKLTGVLNKLAHHFSRGIQVAVITQGIKSTQKLLLLVTK